MTDVVIREAAAGDAEAMAPLFATLGYPMPPELVRERCAALRRDDATARILVGVVHGAVVGVATLHVTPVVHRPTGVGRVTALAVLPSAQGTGVGRRLVEASERHFAELGLRRVEITSGLGHGPAYDFYRHLGYGDHGLRFAKELAPAGGGAGTPAGKD